MVTGFMWKRILFLTPKWLKTPSGKMLDWINDFRNIVDAVFSMIFVDIYENNILGVLLLLF